jgi:phospholipase/carboxylesterase
VRHLIEREIAAGITPERILLAGFSQGGAIVLHTGLRYPRRLAGILALSTYLPLADTLAREADPANRHIPILMAHGTEDGIIPLPRALQSRDLLTRLGYAVEWHSYAMTHGVCTEEITDIAAWLLRTIVPASQ